MKTVSSHNCLGEQFLRILSKSVRIIKVGQKPIVLIFLTTKFVKNIGKFNFLDGSGKKILKAIK